MKKELQEIEQYYNNQIYDGGNGHLQKYMGSLIAEVRQLQDALKGSAVTVNHAQQVIESFEQEIERLEKENNHLRERIKVAIHDFEWDRPNTAYHVIHKLVYDNYGEELKKGAVEGEN